MVWKQSLVVLLTALALVGSPSAASGERGGPHTDDADGTGHGCAPLVSGQLFPYGIKGVGGFFSPSLHGAQLLYFLDTLQPGHRYRLVAEDPTTLLGVQVPDFDIIFDTGGQIVAHNHNGDHTGTQHVVPPGTVAAYVYMPLGPDVDIDANAAMAGFTFDHCTT